MDKKELLAEAKLAEQGINVSPKLEKLIGTGEAIVFTYIAIEDSVSGWIYRSPSDMEKALSLRESEQDRYIVSLVDKNLLKVKTIGENNLRCFKINYRTLTDILDYVE